jgi:hypothetical protein
MRIRTKKPQKNATAGPLVYTADEEEGISFKQFRSGNQPYHQKEISHERLSTHRIL